MPATGANEGEEFKKAKQIRTPKGREGATRCDYIKHPSNKPEPGSGSGSGGLHPQSNAFLSSICLLQFARICQFFCQLMIQFGPSHNFCGKESMPRNYNG